jgi:hypothetical protein
MLQYSALGSNINKSVYFDTQLNYNKYKNTSGFYTTDNTGQTLSYLGFSVHIDPTTIYVVDPVSKAKTYSTQINLGTTAAATQSYTLTHPLFSTQSSAVFSARLDTVNSTPAVVQAQMQNGSAKLTLTALSGTLSGNMNIDFVC